MSLPTQYNGLNQSPVGALSNALGRLQASRPLRELRETVKGVTKQLPEAIQEATSKIDEYARGMISGSGSTLFEELGLYYIGPIDGHNLDNLLAVLKGECDLSSVSTHWRSCKYQALMRHEIPFPILQSPFVALRYHCHHVLESDYICTQVFLLCCMSVLETAKLLPPWLIK